MILAIDYDEVIHAKSKPIPGRRMGGPLDGAKEALEMFTRRGDEVIVFTVMAKTAQGKQVVEDWMAYYKIPYMLVTAVKPNATVFVDDKAIRHVNWPDTMKAIDEIRTAQAKAR